MSASTLSHLECPRCGAGLAYTRPQNLCPKGGSPLLARYDLNKVGTTFSRRALNDCAMSMWRYEEVLAAAVPVSLGEGMTPLVAARRLGEASA